MNATLFFEGPVRSGKSTRLRKLLLPFSSELGDFVVIRLLDSQGSPYAYQLMDMDETTPETFPAVERPFQGTEKNIFLYPGERHFIPQVFEKTGVDILQRSCGKKMILLDEIGGMELTCPDFRAALQKTLAGPVPCTGVFKQQAKARDAASLQEDLRSRIKILQDPGEPAFSKLVAEFLEESGLIR